MKQFLTKALKLLIRKILKFSKVLSEMWFFNITLKELKRTNIKQVNAWTPYVYPMGIQTHCNNQGNELISSSASVI